MGQLRLRQQYTKVDVCIYEVVGSVSYFRKRRNKMNRVTVNYLYVGNLRMRVRVSLVDSGIVNGGLWDGWVYALIGCKVKEKQRKGKRKKKNKGMIRS